MAGLEPTTVSRTRSPELIPGYRLESMLGRGGMGEVHRATQLSLNRTVAVKILASELSRDPSFITRFEKEAAALATLSHPNVVNIVDKGHTESTWYLVMEYIDGPSLREVMRSPLLSTGDALRMVLEIGRGIDYAHSRGVIHRDLKPENILFDEQAGGIPKVTDFGLASFLEGDNQRKYNVTETHVAMGTVSYMAPEQRVDARSADHRADIYALGVILYELVVGEVPMGQFDPPSVRKPDVDPRVDGIVARCLKQDPVERYAKVSDLLAELEPLAPPARSTLRPGPGQPSALSRSVRRVGRSLVRGAASVVVLAALAVLALSWLRSKQPAPDPFPGAAVTRELETQEIVTAPGRLDKDGHRRELAVGDGPDTVPVLAFGRPLTLKGEALVSSPRRDAPAARYQPDVVGIDGESVTVRAQVQVRADESGLDVLLQRVLFAKPPDARALLLLSGTPGRYAAVSLSRAGEPVTFEWAFGERRGVMLGPPSPENGNAVLELVIDEGQLRAFIGEGKDRRAIAEPVSLGREWKDQFGGAAHVAVGCLDGTCRFERVQQVASSRPPPPPPPAPVVQAPPREVAPARATTRAVTKPTRATQTKAPSRTVSKKSTTRKR